MWLRSAGANRSFTADTHLSVLVEPGAEGRTAHDLLAELPARIENAAEFAARDKDWADVTSILERPGGKLDLEIVRSELAPLVAAKEALEIDEQLKHRIQRHWKPDQ